jgi:hypothetical protein
LIYVKKSSILDCETFRKTLCYTVMIIGISGFIVYNFDFEENNLRLGASFATTTNSGISNSSQNTNTTSSSSANTSLTEAKDTIDKLVKSEIKSTTFSGANTSSLDSSKSNSINLGGSDDLYLSDPFYTSKSSKVLNKLSLHPASDSTSTKELQIFYELGLIDNLEAVHNIGYYVEGSKYEVDLNKHSIDNRNTDASSSNDNHVKFAKGTGFYVATDADIIGWNAYDQVFNYSDDVTKYLGIIYFSTNEIAGGKLSELNHKVGIYEYDLYSNGSAIRNIWLWPTTTPITTQTDINTSNGNSNSCSWFGCSSSSSRYHN